MDFSFVTENFIPVVMLGSLLLGYVLKKWVNDVDNKWIPTILCVFGAVATCLVNGAVSVENIVYGAMAGLASTGMHQAFKSFIEKE